MHISGRTADSDSPYIYKEKERGDERMDTTMKETRTPEASRKTLTRLVLAGIFAAITYVVFTFLSIPVPLPSGKVSVHLGNAFVALGALLLGVSDWLLIRLDISIPKPIRRKYWDGPSPLLSLVWSSIPSQILESVTSISF